MRRFEDSANEIEVWSWFGKCVQWVSFYHAFWIFMSLCTWHVSKSVNSFSHFTPPQFWWILTVTVISQRWNLCVCGFHEITVWNSNHVQSFKVAVVEWDGCSILASDDCVLCQGVYDFGQWLLCALPGGVQLWPVITVCSARGHTILATDDRVA